MQRERDDDRVVGVAQEWDEVRDEVDRQRQVAQQQR
jgi:hypothetical protein